MVSSERMSGQQLCRGPEDSPSRGDSCTMAWHLEVSNKCRAAEVRLVGLGARKKGDRERTSGSRGLKGVDVARKLGEEEREGQEAERALRVMILKAEQLILVASPRQGHEAEGEGRRGSWK